MSFWEWCQIQSAIIFSACLGLYLVVFPVGLFELRILLTLWLRSFYTRLGYGVNFLQTFTWHGVFFQRLLFGTDFFLWYSCFLGWKLKLRPHPQYKVSEYTLILKRRTRKFNFLSYVLKLVKINISFFFQRLVVLGTIYRPAVPACTISSSIYQPSMSEQANEAGRFIGQTCQLYQIFGLICQFSQPKG